MLMHTYTLKLGDIDVPNPTPHLPVPGVLSMRKGADPCVIGRRAYLVHWLTITSESADLVVVKCILI